MNVRDRNDSIWRHEGVGTLDDHIACGVHEDERCVTGVRLHEPDDNRNIVRDALEGHRHGAVGLQKVDCAAVVVVEDGGLGLQRRVSLREVQQVLPDVPLHVLRVRQRRRAALRQHAIEELLRVLLHFTRKYVYTDLDSSCKPIIDPNIFLLQLNESIEEPKLAKKIP